MARAVGYPIFEFLVPESFSSANDVASCTDVIRKMATDDVDFVLPYSDMILVRSEGPLTDTRIYFLRMNLNTRDTTKRGFTFNVLTAFEEDGRIISGVDDFTTVFGLHNGTFTSATYSSTYSDGVILNNADPSELRRKLNSGEFSEADFSFLAKTNSQYRYGLVHEIVSFLLAWYSDQLLVTPMPSKKNPVSFRRKYNVPSTVCYSRVTVK
jgi:hypothetical protein